MSAITCVSCKKTFEAKDTLIFGPHRVCRSCKADYFQRFFEGIPTGLPQYAGVVRRAAAKMIDGLLLFAVNLPILALALYGVVPEDFDLTNPQTLSRLNLVYFTTQIVIYTANITYTTYFHGRWGATIGKMVMGIKVVQQDGAPISYKLALGRAFAELLSALTLYIGYMMVVLQKEHAALHDLICDTRTIVTDTEEDSL